jgi:hypothetical protein
MLGVVVVGEERSNVTHSGPRIRELRAKGSEDYTWIYMYLCLSRGECECVAAM